MKRLRAPKILGAFFVCLSFALAAPAGADWRDKPVAEWSLREVQDFMLDSPWVVRVNERLGAIGGGNDISPVNLALDHPLRDEVTADIMAWRPGDNPDPGLGRKRTAKRQRKGHKVRYHVRWYSAHIMREALVRGAELGGSGMSKMQATHLLRDDEVRYIVTVSGPGLAALDQIPLEQLAESVSLTTAEGNSFPLIDVRTPKELSGTAEAMFFFDRTDGASTIPPVSLGVTFLAEIGRAKFKATFNPREMVRDGEVDLQGTPSADPTERLRRELELVLLRGADPAFKRALANTELREKPGQSTPDLIVLFDSRRDGPEGFEKRMKEAAARIGNVAERIRLFWFIDPNTQAQAYLYGADCVILGKLSGETAERYFADRVQRPRASE